MEKCMFKCCENGFMDIFSGFSFVQVLCFAFMAIFEKKGKERERKIKNE